MITILGTSHVSPESIKALQKLVKNKDCVCVELDPIRYHALLNKDHANAKPPGIFLRLLHDAQTKLSKSTGSDAGEEMLAAVRLAQSHKIPAYLIDHDIRITFGKLRKAPLLEKMSLLIPLIITPHKYDFKKVPSERIVTTAMKELRKIAPVMYNTLVEERNQYMAAWIERISQKHERVLVVVGAAHSKGLEKLLKAEGLKIKRV